MVRFSRLDQGVTFFITVSVFRKTSLPVQLSPVSSQISRERKTNSPSALSWKIPKNPEASHTLTAATIAFSRLQRQRQIVEINTEW